MVLRDLNVVLDESEKRCEDREVQGATNELSEFLNDTGLLDLCYYGHKYTWTNSHTWCKLDRVLVNSDW